MESENACSATQEFVFLCRKFDSRQGYYTLTLTTTAVTDLQLVLEDFHPLRVSWRFWNSSWASRSRCSFTDKISLFAYKYRNVPKFSDRQVWANSVDPDQTSGAVWSGSTLFAFSSASFGRITLSKATLFECQGDYCTFSGVQIFRIFTVIDLSYEISVDWDPSDVQVQPVIRVREVVLCLKIHVPLIL